MDTHEKISGDSTKRSEILFLLIKIKQTFFPLRVLTVQFKYNPFFSRIPLVTN